MATSSSIMRMEPACAPSKIDGLKGATTALDMHGLPYQRELQMKRGAHSRPAIHVDLAGMFLDDAVGHRQPQSGAAILPITARSVLGGEKWIVDALDVL